jgi:hypothetical protein
LFALCPQVQICLQRLPHQLPCPRREQLFQFRVGGVASIDWVSRLLDQGVEHRAGGLERLQVRVCRIV